MITYTLAFRKPSADLYSKCPAIPYTTAVELSEALRDAGYITEIWKNSTIQQVVQPANKPQV
jgi:hypothetical protein